MRDLNRAIKAQNGMTALATALGTTKGVVYQWKKRGRVPAEYCPEIEKLTNGAAICEELNPTVDWAYVRATPRATVRSRRKTDLKP